MLLRDIPRRRKLRAGMVGGGRGAFFASIHRAAMRLCDRFDLVAGAFSSDPEVGRQAGEAFDLEPSRIYASVQDMARAEAARSDPIDVAIVVTPNHLHFEACRLFLEAGIPVICDKPLVHALDEARELLRLAEERNVFFAVTYTYSGYPMVRDARARIRGGEIGDLRFLYVEYLLEWLANDPSKLGKGGVWRGDPAKAGPTAALGDVGTHAFHMLEFLTDRRCTALNAKLTNATPGWALEDTAVVQLEFEGGVDGLLWTSLAAPGHRNGLRFKIVGSLGTLEWRQEAPETLHLSRLGRADIIYRRGGDDMTEAGRTAVSLPAGNPEAYIEALAVLYADLAAALEAGAGWRDVPNLVVPTLVEGLRGVALSEACVESDRRRAWTAFPGEDVQ